MDYKIYFGYAAVVIGIISYIPYFRGLFSGKTKPHAFSWLVWTISVGIAFAAQLSKGGGAGTWVTGLTALIQFIIFIFAVFKGDWKFALVDWVSFIVALGAIGLWIFTKNPVFSVILVTLSDAFVFFPTIRKGYYKPQEDKSMLWALTAIKWLISIIALNSYSLTTLLYPAYLTIFPGLFSIMLAWRSRKLDKINLSALN
jgi:hypothetical protein